MTIEELIIYGKKQIHSAHAKMLLADLLGMNSLELLNHLQDKISTETVDIYKKKISELTQNKPIQYVLGTVNFYGYLFQVNENVLIPRFETEELVENTLKMIECYVPQVKKVIDLGTGSGAIGITLKKEKSELEVTLVDISAEALQVAQENARRLASVVELKQSDMWQNISEKYDLVISNPPYIKLEEPIEIIVKENEPNLALYGGIDGLDYYRQILSSIRDHLNEEYLIAFEIGETQKEAVTLLLQDALPESQIIAKQDLQGRDRMIFAYHTKNTSL